MRRILGAFLAVLPGLLLVNCSDDEKEQVDKTVNFPDIALDVTAEVQYLSPELITQGDALDMYLAQHYKMLAQSAPVFQAVTQNVAESNSQALLIAGDLTANGAKKSHREVAAMLGEVEKAGKEVYVIPGPHDINNYNAVTFTETGYQPVPRVSAKEFASIYQSFGYGQAIARDPSSLSYVAPLKENLWLLAIDAGLYAQNTRDTLVKAGAITAESMGWIMEQLRAAAKNDIKVIGMMNHNLVEHHIGQGGSSPEDLLADWNAVADSLATAGLHVLFTGSADAIDAVRKPTPQDQMVLDIQAGSPLVFPSTYRTVEISNGDALKLSDLLIGSIAYDTGGSTFPEFAENYLDQSLNRLVPYQLQAFNLTQEEINQLQPLMTGGMKAFLSGSEAKAWEQVPDSTQLKIEDWMYDTDPDLSRIGGLLFGLYHDTSPSDTEVTLNLGSGKMQE